MHASSTSKEKLPDSQRRNCLRHPVKVQANGKGVGGNRRFEGLLLNLSVGGFLLETEADLTFGETFELDLPGAGGHAARIAWASAPLFGCEFLHPLDESLVSGDLLDGEPLQSEVAHIGKEIKSLRIAKGWTRADLAEKAGVSRPSVWGWETGKTMPRHDALRRLSRAFGSRVFFNASQLDHRSHGANPCDVSTEAPADPRQSDECNVPLESLLTMLQTTIAKRLGLPPSRIKVRFEIRPE